MPIRPENRARYPKDWPAISRRIRNMRANGRCECEGECATGHRGRCPAFNHLTHPITGSKVVLTVAHLDHRPENCADDNLKAMCQRCHLAYDAVHHAQTAARTRTQRQSEHMDPLWPDEPETPPDPAPAPGEQFRAAWRQAESQQARGKRNRRGTRTTPAAAGYRLPR